VKYENVFRFTQHGSLQLNKVSLNFPKGIFVGVVGQRCWKSTLMKLLPRLYELESGRILIDGYDVSKVELYSLRRQRVVLQDTLCLMAPCRRILLTNRTPPEAIVEASRLPLPTNLLWPYPYNTRVGERGASLWWTATADCDHETIYKIRGY